MFDIVVGPRLVFRRGKMSMLDTWTCCGTWACLAVAHLLDATIGFCGGGVGTGNVVALAQTFDATSCVLYAQLSYSISAGSCLTVSEFSG